MEYNDILLAMRRTKISHYYAIFNPAKEGGYNVSFPTLPGCLTFGRTFEEAKAMAEEVLELWLEELRADREKIPPAEEQPIALAVRVRVPASR